MDTLTGQPPLPAHAWVAPISRQIWEEKYRLKAADGTPLDRTIEDTWRRVARALAAVEPRPELWEERFYAALVDFRFLPAGRIVSGAGTARRVTLFNCFVMGEIADDLGSIFANLREAALTMQQGGGIGYDFSTLRPKGAPVRGVSADASGPLSFMDVWDAMCRTIMSAGSRRGAMMATLRCDHPDIEAFIAAKREPGRLRNFNLSVLVTDAFMAAVDADAEWPLAFGGVTYRTVRARALWDAIMRATYDYAEPGVLFIDRINARNNLWYCETIHSTNPCVTGDTWVETENGPAQVRDLIGKKFTAIVNGQPWASDARGFFVTGTKPVFRLATKEGFSLRLTADHPLLTVSSRTRHTIGRCWRAAGELRPGDRNLLNDHRTRASWNGSHDFGREVGYLVGLLIGDGTLKSDKAVLSVWRPGFVEAVNGGSAPICGVDGMMERAVRAAMALPHRSDFEGWMEVGRANEWRMVPGALKHIAGKLGMRPQDKHVTPAIESCSSEFYKGFLSGFFDCDGSVQGSHAKGVSVRLNQSHLRDLQAVQRMLLRLGIRSTIYQDRRLGQVRQMRDGKGGKKGYATKANHELVISGTNMARFADLVGFSDTEKASCLSLLLKGYQRQINRERFTAEVELTTPDGMEIVYDVSIPGLNAFDANGFVAHNCAEQPLPPYGACLLGSVNLARLVRDPFTPAAHLDEAQLADLVGVAVRMLDNTIDASGFPLEEQRREAMAKRRIGLGLTGLADALMMVGLRYGSPEAAEAAGRWMALVNRAAYTASAHLAAEKGAFPLFDRGPYLAGETVRALDPEVRALVAEKGIRNALLTSIAPTGTISLLADNVASGVEPVFAHAFTRKVLQADGGRREELVEDYAVRLYRARFGADAALPEHFVTAQTLTPAEHVRMQAALQRHVDSAISKTVNVPEDIAFEAFQEIYRDAYRSGCKGCATYRPNAVTGSVLAAAPAPVPGPVPVPAPAVPQPAHEPMTRPRTLTGSTYKLRWADSPHALYVTVNDIEEAGRRRPFEVFIASASMEHFAWVVALTRMISAVFRRGGEVGFVAEELKGIFDPRGGQWMDGRYVPSLIAAIGGVIERHMIETGFLPASEATPAPAAGAAAVPAGGLGMLCPRCSQPGVVREGACLTCRQCGWSRCG